MTKAVPLSQAPHCVVVILPRAANSASDGFVDSKEEKPLPDNPKKALEGYIKVQLPKYLNWYSKVSTHDWYFLSTIEWGSIVLGLSPAFFAALARLHIARHWENGLNFCTVVFPASPQSAGFSDQDRAEAHFDS
jgi:hypothetical protein